jgi:hypothetical protein
VAQLRRKSESSDACFDALADVCEWLGFDDDQREYLRNLKSERAGIFKRARY